MRRNTIPLQDDCCRAEDDAQLDHRRANVPAVRANCDKPEGVQFVLGPVLWARFHRVPLHLCPGELDGRQQARHHRPGAAYEAYTREDNAKKRTSSLMPADLAPRQTWD
uniref:Uncharacterized protein n=1 Tax=Mycena chlorophos TaxID=658473 RepID=A0ABQ0LWU0_MYCCL|nr:predicted protein [Mycena chlorophos]